MIEPGSGYVKSKLVNCKRGVSGISNYDSKGNIVFKNEKLIN